MHLELTNDIYFLEEAIKVGLCNATLETFKSKYKGVQILEKTNTKLKDILSTCTNMYLEHPLIRCLSFQGFEHPCI